MFKHITLFLVGALVTGLAGCASPADVENQSSKIESKWVEFTGNRIYYETVGEGCPVVLIGGGGGMDRRQWDHQFETFGKRYRTIRWDPRDTGKTGAAVGPYSDPEDLAAVLDAEAIERATVIGVSSGGKIALEFSILHPDRVVAVVGGAPFVPGFDHTDEFMERIATFAQAGEKGKEIFVDAMLADAHFVPAPDKPEVRAMVRRLMSESYDIPFDPAFPREMEPPLIKRLGEVFAPTLLLVETLDHPDLLRRTEFVRDSIPDAKIVMIDQAGHVINMEQPEAFNEAVQAFLQTLDCPGK